MIDVSDPVVVTAGAAVLAALTSAVKVLWDRNTALSKTTDIALSKCEAEHVNASAKVDVLVQKVIELSGQVGKMQGRIEGFQEATGKVVDVHLNGI